MYFGKLDVTPPILLPRNRYGLLLAAFFFVFMASSCESRPTRTFVLPPPTNVTPAAETYTLVEGDVLRLVFYKNSALPSNTPYLIGVGDELKITVENRPEFTTIVRVLPDGTITLPVAGVVTVAGMTVAKCSEDISQRFGAKLANPRIDVIMQHAGARLDEMYAGLTASQEPGGQPLAIEQGHLHAPLLPPVVAAGRTMAAVRAELSQSYANIQQGLGVALALVRRHERSIMVAGEVKQSGRFVINEPVSVIGALTLAGGATDRATLYQVIVASARPDGSVAVTELDLRNTFGGSEATGWSTMVPENSIIFVPMSTISNLNLFVEQYIRNMLLIQLSAGVYVPVLN